MNFISALFAVALLSKADGVSWQPRTPLSGAVMRDFVNSRALPTTSLHGPQAGAGAGGGGTSSISAKSANGITEDVARGGHASIKTRGDEDEEQRDDGANDTHAETDVAPTVRQEVDEPSFEAVNLDVKVGKEAKEARRRASSAAKIAKKLKNRNHTNIRRKVMHANFGLSFGILNFLLPKNVFVPACAAISGVTLVIELLRYKPEYQWMNELSYSLVGSSIRKHEMEGNFTGILYFFMGVTLTSALFSKPCATLGIFQLGLADPSASYFGTKTKHVYWSRIEGGLGGFGRNKGILGFLGGALFCMPFNYRVLSIAKWATPQTRTTLAVASLALGLAGAFADLAVPSPVMTLPKRILGRRVPPFHIDDNFVVPIFSAFAAEKVFGALGFPLDLELAKFVWF